MRYRDLFLTESREHLGAAHDALSRLSAEPGDAALLDELLRHAHSLKGMAVTMGQRSMVELAHAVEDACDGMRHGPVRADLRPFALLDEALICLDRIVDAFDRGEPDALPAATGLARELRRLAAARGISAAGPLDCGAAEPVPDGAQTEPGRWWIGLQLAPGTARTARPTVETLRALGRLGRVERVAPPTLSGDPLRFGGRLELTLAAGCGRDRLAEALEGLTGVEGFDLEPAPPTARIEQTDPSAERWARVRADLLDELAGLALDLMLEQGRARAECAVAGGAPPRQLERSEFLVKRLYGRLMEMRLTPFASAAERLRRSVEQLSRRLGKPVRFEIRGSDTCLDRSLIDALFDPLQHMVRNAVDHGFESSQQRRSAGKPACGRLALSLHREPERLLIALEDDGRGICPEALRRAAVERGFVDRDTARRMSDEEAWMLITLPAFSTARRLTEVSGRGVGMDVVRNRVERVGGRLVIRSRTGSGTRIELRFPLALALVRSLVLRCGGELYALPAASVRATRRLQPGASDGESALALGERLGLQVAADGGISASSLRVNRDRGLLDLRVDEVLGVREIVVRPLGAPLAGLPPYAGAALLEDGTIVLVLDPDQL
jgi:two-component system chemotaxis sensor kinase CheA